METVFVFFILFTAVFVQTFIGFGSAMIAMGLLAALLGLQIAAPLFALIAVIFEAGLVIYYRETIEIKAVARISAATLAGIPLGLVFLSRIPEGLLVPLLGTAILGYALFTLGNPAAIRMEHPAWPYALGLLSGLMGGAYNITGPPVIVYGNSQQWPPQTFKANLQGFFVITTLALVAGHVLAGNYTAVVMDYVGVGIAAAAAGMTAGIVLEKRIAPGLFRKAVLWGLAILGLRLILG